MGESRGGEGRAAGPTVMSIIEQLLDEFNDDERQLGSLRVFRATEGVYQVDIVTHGEEPYETLYIGLVDST